jgi:hypothetical protein
MEHREMQRTARVYLPFYAVRHHGGEFLEVPESDIWPGSRNLKRDITLNDIQMLNPYQ